MFHTTVTEAMRQRSEHAEKVKQIDLLKVLAAPNVILNISDGHNHAEVSISEDEDVMQALRDHAVCVWQNG